MELAVEQSITQLARSATRAIEPYVWEAASHEIAARYGIDASQVVRFDTNTAPLPPPCLTSVLRQVEAVPDVNEYFDSSYASLAQALSEYTGYAPENLVIGAGADEILDIVAKTFLDPRDTVVVPTPTYSMYRIVSQTLDVHVQTVPSRADLGFDVDAIVAAAKNAKLIFLCNPNNPTGLTLPTAEIARLVKSVRCMVVVDEAYAEFSGESALPLVRDEPRLIVIRTLSKAFSLAGARLGYAVCAPEVVDLASRVRPPNSVSYISAVLGEAAVRDTAAVQANVSSLIIEREWLAAALEELGLPVTPSSTNFVLVKLPSAEVAAKVHEACLSQGLVLRFYDANPVLNSYLRITARRRADNVRLIEALRAALS
ncbi:MAG: histidinol-phosphate aminotransferase [Chloroflexi bacterium]|jgi:histidinol-phosphate aminotransferase|nr:histidinol-phosphate aminotransferase [Chloroflexota bacterium]